MKENRLAIVTGASRGIGKAIAKELAWQNYNLGLIGRNEEKLEEVKNEIKRETYGVVVSKYKCDIRNIEEVRETFDDIHREGGLDVLVNNAGVNLRGSISLDGLDWFEGFKENLLKWNGELETNLTGTYICSYVAAFYMSARESGSIINISSIKGVESTSSFGYGSSKAGVIKQTRDFAKALAKYRIRVNCVIPGFINTGMTSELSNEKKDMYKEMTPQLKEQLEYLKQFPQK